MSVEYNALPLVEDPALVSTILASIGGVKGRLTISEFASLLAAGSPLATAISSGKVFALQQISTNGVQIAESTTLVEILAIDLYVVTSAQTAPSWRLIFGAYGLHLVPSDYGGAGVVTINGVADIVTFAEAGVYLLVGDGANAWTLTPATDYDAIDGAIAAVQDAADAAQTRADDAYDLAQDAYNGLSGKQDNLSTISADVSINSHKLTNLADPVAAQDAATKAYADALANGLDWKASCRLATTTNDSLSGLAARDGVTPVANDRVLVKDHATGSSKGIYLASSGSWSRAPDADSSAEVTSGMSVFVAEGTVNGGKTFVLTTADPIVLGTTALTFSQSASAPGLSNATPQAVSGTGSAGTSNAGAARDDHTHAHGSQTDGSHHAAATTSVAGFMSAADKVNANLLNPLAAMPSYGTVKGLFDASGCTDFIAISNGLAPFTGANSGTGAGASVGSITGSPTNRVGIASLTTGTDTTGRAAIAGSFGGGITFTGGSWAYRCDLNIPTAADVTDTFSGVAGFVDVLSSLPSYGAYFRYQYTENSGNWTCVTVSGGVETTTTTGVAAVHATSYRALEILVNAAGTSVQFWVDGVLKATHTTNIPGVWGIGPAVGIRKSAGTTARTLLVDLMGMLFTATSGR